MNKWDTSRRLTTGFSKGGHVDKQINCPVCKEEVTLNIAFRKHLNKHVAKGEMLETARAEFIRGSTI